MRVGIGYDVHKLVKGRKLIIGGIEIPFKKGLMGHSDADVLIHAICDALLGAAGLGDIGLHFPDTNPAYKGISSMQILRKTVQMVLDNHYSIVNIDTVIFAEDPKMSPYRQVMKTNIAAVMNLDPGVINVKATTTEGLGPVGRGEGIGAVCVALLQ
jgi:2-C-methyl-D-erythritol 2,4-cyclodiphosphate synthase